MLSTRKILHKERPIKISKGGYNTREGREIQNSNFDLQLENRNGYGKVNDTIVPFKQRWRENHNLLS